MSPDSEFKTLPENLQSILQKVQEAYSIEIKPILRLDGGRSGAVLYLAKITDSNSGSPTHCILKLDVLPIWDGEQSEFQRHQLASSLSPKDFAIEHLASFVFEPFDDLGLSAIFYTVAGDSLQQCRPISAFSQQSQLEAVYGKVSEEILSKWQPKLHFDLVTPRKILESLLGYRIDPEKGNIAAFLREIGTDTGKVILSFEEELLPNPLLFSQEDSVWGLSRKIDAAVGMTHGDLHNQNVLASFGSNGDLDNYFIIDFANFQDGQFLFYDNSYLELSLLVGQLDSCTITDWFKVASSLSTLKTECTSVSHRLLGACQIILSSRRGLSQWISEHHKDKIDDLEGQRLLASVAAGLNFSNKKSLGDVERFASFIYAAMHLKEYCRRFGINVVGDSGQLSLSRAPKETYAKPDDWDAFFDACHDFSRDRLYVLVIGKQDAQGLAGAEFFGQIPLSVVFDFDSMEQELTFYGLASNGLREHRAVHLQTCDDAYYLNPLRATYWYVANGLHGRSTTIPETEGFRHWNRKYSRPIEKFLIDFAAASELPVSVVVLFDESEYVEKLCEMIDLSIGDRAEYIVSLPEPADLNTLVSKYAAKAFRLRIDEIGFGLKRFFNSPVNAVNRVLLPAEEAAPVELSASEYSWLEEELDIIHLDCGIREDEGREVGRDFRRGKRISWFELGIFADVERQPKTSQIQTQVLSDLKDRNSTRINLFHFPGAGGTTLALRVAWNVHREFPTIVLRKCTLETVQRLNKVYRLTGRSILVVVESSDISVEILNKLYVETQVANLPIVFLIVTRRFAFLKDAERSFYLSQHLDIPEAEKFSQVFGKDEPTKRSQLKSLVDDSSMSGLRTPFYFGLTAYEDDFVKIESYVADCLLDLDERERAILCFLGLAYKYAQKAIPSQLFANELGISLSRVVQLERVLKENRRPLLIHDENNEWRPAHYLVAEEIIFQILAGSGPRENWIHSLSIWATRLIDVLASFNSSGMERINTFTAELSNRLFIHRDSDDTLNESGERSRFARLIEDIPTEEGKLSVLENLVKAFPYEPHFHAHYARFLSSKGEHEKALKEADTAIELDVDNDVLHHIKGLVIRNKIYDLIRKAERMLLRDGSIPREEEKEILAVSSEAELEFKICRELAVENDYGYVSHVQMLIRLVEFGFHISGKRNKTDFLTDTNTLNYQEMVERAEIVLDEVKRLRGGRKMTDYIETCETDINEIYGNYTLVIEKWNSMLDRRDVFRPPLRRRLARTYLGRGKRDWDSLPLKEIKRIYELMEENLLEEPDDEKNVRLWFNAARRLPTVTIDGAIERFTYLFSRTKALDVLYYVYVMQTLKAIDGVDLAKVKAENYSRELQQRTRNSAVAKYSYDWLGTGPELTQLVSSRRLGRFKDETNFFENESPLRRISGRVARADRSESGNIELECGMKAFFVPQLRRGQGSDVFYSSDVNANVTFYLGFSSEGLRAWSVKFKDPR